MLQPTRDFSEARRDQLATHGLVSVVVLAHDVVRSQSSVGSGVVEQEQY